MGKSSLIWDIAVLFRTKTSLWDREVSCGKEQAHIRLSSVMWDREAFCGTEESWNILEPSKYFSMIFKSVLMSKIYFFKFDKSWNVLEPSKYFSMIFKSVLDCQKVKNIFREV